MGKTETPKSISEEIPDFNIEVLEPREMTEGCDLPKPKSQELNIEEILWQRKSKI